LPSGINSGSFLSFSRQELIMFANWLGSTPLLSVTVAGRTYSPFTGLVREGNGFLFSREYSGNVAPGPGVENWTVEIRRMDYFGALSSAPAAPLFTVTTDDDQFVDSTGFVAANTILAVKIEQKLVGGVSRDVLSTILLSGTGAVLQAETQRATADDSDELWTSGIVGGRTAILWDNDSGGQQSLRLLILRPDGVVAVPETIVASGGADGDAVALGFFNTSPAFASHAVWRELNQGVNNVDIALAAVADATGVVTAGPTIDINATDIHAIRSTFLTGSNLTSGTRQALLTVTQTTLDLNNQPVIGFGLYVVDMDSSSVSFGTVLNTLSGTFSTQAVTTVRTVRLESSTVIYYTDGTTFQLRQYDDNLVEVNSHTIALAATQTARATSMGDGRLLVTLTDIVAGTSTVTYQILDTRTAALSQSLGTAAHLIAGTVLADEVNLGGGDDLMDGAAGDDIIRGQEGSDTLRGGAGNDTLIGGSGFDTMEGGAGNDTLIGGNEGATVDDNDNAASYIRATGGVVVSLGATSTVTGDASVGTDTLVLINTVYGSDFADSFTAAAVHNGSVSSVYDPFNMFAPGGGNDIVTGNGSTTLDYRTALAGITVNLNLGTAQGTAAGDLAGIGLDTFTGVQAVLGSAFADVLTGRDVFNDSLRGGAGNDVLDGGTGNDRADYRDSLSSVVANLQTGTAQDGQNGTDTLISIENLRGGRGNDTLTGDFLANTLDGREGNDTLLGGGDNDQLFGRAGEDTLRGGDGDDTLEGGTEFDVLDGGSGNDTLWGNSATSNADTDGNAADYRNATGGITVTLGQVSAFGGQVTGNISVGTDTLNGVSDIWATAFADTITVTAQFSALSVIRPGNGDDVITGNGRLRVDYRDAAAAIAVNLVAGTAGTLGGGNAAAIGSDTFTNVNAVTGSAFGDTLLGSDRTDVRESFRGLGGNDLIDGKGGRDQADYRSSAAGSVNVNLVTGVAQDGFSGTDTLVGIEDVRGSTTSDTITGDDNANDLDGDNGNDVINGGGGNDQIFGGGGGDTLNGGAGNDSLYTGNDASVDTVNGGADFDVLFLQGNGGNGVTVNGSNTTQGSGNASSGGITDTYSNIEVLIGTVQNDFFFGGGFDEQFSGGQGNDTFDGGFGFDTAVFYFDGYFLGAAGITVSMTGFGSGTVTGALSGTDSFNSIERIFGGFGNDIFYGGSGIDNFGGNLGDDQLYGGDGDDLLFGDQGNDLAVGGIGSDSLYGGFGADTIFGGAGIDFIYGDDDGDYLDGEGDVDVIYGGNGGDTLVGRAGGDYLDGGFGVDVILGGDEGDSLIGGEDYDFLFGEAGVDVLLGGNGGDLLYGGADQDYIFGENDGDFVLGEGGDDIIYGGEGADSLYGNADNDFLTGENGGDVLYGGTGSDSLLGGAGVDYLFGEDGIDVLRGGQGTDVLSGGTGLDYFDFRAVDMLFGDADVISDFSLAEGDRILIDPAMQLGAVLAQAGADVTITLQVAGNPITITVAQATLADVTAGLLYV
jgi:Ca2+-binding RTX toxin-like protein